MHRESIQGATAFCPDLPPNLNRKSAKIGSRQPGCILPLLATASAQGAGAWKRISSRDHRSGGGHCVFQIIVWRPLRLQMSA